jgi:hypothetical protein
VLGLAAALACDATGQAVLLGPNVSLHRPSDAPGVPMPLCVWPAAPTPRPSLLSPEFENTCGGCHGRFGEGRAAEGTPPLPGKATSLDGFLQIVRRGVGTTMPAAAAGDASDESLRKDFEVLRSTPVAERAALAMATPRPRERPRPVRMAAADIERAVAEGLPIWRKAGLRGPCAGCHAPDAVDLARIAYADSDILRWGLRMKLPSTDGQAIVRLGRAIRARHNMTELCDPDAGFLQPGGQALTGTNRVTRDVAMAGELAAQGFDLAGAEIHSHGEARELANRMAALDLFKLRQQLRFPRWSEDRFHGEERASLRDWVPEYPRVSVAGQEAAWWALHDRYLAAPTPENLWAIHDAVKTMTTASPFADDGLRPTRWMRHRYSAVLVASHMMRDNLARPPALYTEEERAWLWRAENDARSELLRERAPFWSAGASASGASSTTPVLPELAPFVIERTGFDDKRAIEDIARSVIPFEWLGWAADPPLQFTDGGWATSADLVGRFHRIEGQEFVVHRLTTELLLVGKRVEAADETMKRNRLGARARNGEWNNVHNGAWKLVENLGADDDVGGWFYVKKEMYPAADVEEQRRVFNRMRRNWIKLVMYLGEEALLRFGKTGVPTAATVMKGRDWLLRFGPPEERAEVEALAARLIQKL